MRYGFLEVAALAGISSATAAQQQDVRAELRPFVGALVPTGDHRSDFKTGATLGLQGALEVTKYAHVVANLAWTQGRAKFATFTDDLTYVWHYDVGAEVNAYFETDQFLVRPFLGIGAGMRTYDYKASGQPARSCGTGYASLGSELQIGSIAFRAEGRDYLNCFESPVYRTKSTRNDLMLMLGFAYHLW